MESRDALRLALAAVVVWSLTSAAPHSAVAQAPPNSGEVELLFLYGSEKEKWIDAVTSRFNAAAHLTSSGQRIRVVTKPAGSGEIIDDLLAEKEGRKAHLVSPAGGAFIDRGNYRAHEDGKEDLIGPTVELVRSPIVVAMWRDMAQAIGWGKRPITWREIFDYAREPARWQAAVRRPEWGTFKFGHTHPDFSNSGLHALFAEVYAALNKYDNVTRRDLNERREEVDQYLHDVENAVIHYGSSTGFLAKKMRAEGRDYLYAAILYENLVIEANEEMRKKNPALPMPQVVAIYPAEGTFPSEHPIGIVRRPWVTDRHRDAAEIYVNYLRAKLQQEEAKRFGLRPFDPSIPLQDLLKPELGVDPTEPKSLLKPPPASVFNLITDAWSRNKRPADIVLAIDISGSMKGEKIRRTEEAAKIFIDMLRESDHLSTLIFGAEVEWQAKDLVMTSDGKAEAKQSVDSLPPGGDTALFQAILEGYKFLESRDPKRNRAIVLLSDGNDTKRKTTLDEVLRYVRFDGRNNSIFIFTIAYGLDADPELLGKIAKATQAETYKDSNDKKAIENIYNIFIKIATFF